MNYSKLILGSSVAAAVSLVTMGVEPAHAQSRYTIEEVMVSARRVEEGLQEAPIAISAFSSNEMENRGVIDVTDIAAASPNVTLEAGGATSGFAAAPVTFIRGIGQADFVINTDPAVGLYVDGVYMGRSMGSVMDLLDLERVEVLRGPQGTLFGKNTIGGALNLVSKAPSVEDGLTGKLEGTFGERSLSMLRGNINVPLGDNTAARLSAFKRERDGYQNAAYYDGFKLGEEDVWGARGALQIDFSDNLTLTTGFDYSDRNDSPAPMLATDLGDAGVVDANGNPANGTPTNPIGARFNGVPLGPPPGREAWLATPDGPVSNVFLNPDGTTIASRTVDCTSDPALNSSSQCYGDFWLNDASSNNSIWTDASGNMIEPEQQLEVWGAYANLTWSGDWGEFKSITSYREFDSEFYNDNDFSPYIIFHNMSLSFSQEQFSQEFQLTGSVGDKLDYLVGLYYFEEEGLQQLGASFPNIPPCAASVDRPTCFETFRDIENTTDAAFSQLTFHATDSIDFTLGLRYTDSEKIADTSQFTDRFEPGDAAGVTAGIGTVEAQEVDYLLNVAWQASDDAMIYASASTGFRDGGFPSRFPGGIPDDISTVQFDPEFVDAYELGIKSSFLDNALQLNAAIFFTDYQDIQVDAASSNPEIGNSPTVNNLAAASLQGIEVEAVWVANDSLRFDLALGYLDSQIDEVEGGSATAGAGNTQVEITTSNELPYNPELQLNLGINYSYYFGDGAEVRTRFDYQYMDEMFFTVENRPVQFLESFDRINVNASYIPGGSPWEFVVGVRNLTDEEYSTAGQINLTAASASRNIARPREAYVTVKYSFGDY